MIKNAVAHLTGSESKCEPLKTIILEICGNSIEWGGDEKQGWLIGAQYFEKDGHKKVLFTLTDLGRGILKTLHRRFGLKLWDTLLLTSDREILEGAFVQKYGSASLEPNRARGLPSVRQAFVDEKIQNLKVLTNNVILDFMNPSNSRTLSKGKLRFRGTFYQWEMNNECLNKLS